MRVLIVEDEMLLAMDMEAMIEDSGHALAGEAASLSDVEDLASDQPDLALVDMQLRDRSSGLDVARLIRRRWPATKIVFVTANPKQLPDDFAGAQGVISKPFSRNGLISALHYVSAGMGSAPSILPIPDSFTPAPAPG